MDVGSESSLYVLPPSSEYSLTAPILSKFCLTSEYGVPSLTKTLRFVCLPVPACLILCNCSWYPCSWRRAFTAISLVGDIPSCCSIPLPTSMYLSLSTARLRASAEAWVILALCLLSWFSQLLIVDSGTPILLAVALLEYPLSINFWAKFMLDLRISSEAMDIFALSCVVEIPNSLAICV